MENMRNVYKFRSRCPYKNACSASFGKFSENIFGSVLFWKNDGKTSAISVLHHGCFPENFPMFGNLWAAVCVTGLYIKYFHIFLIHFLLSKFISRKLLGGYHKFSYNLLPNIRLYYVYLIAFTLFHLPTSSNVQTDTTQLADWWLTHISQLTNWSRRSLLLENA